MTLKPRTSSLPPAIISLSTCQSRGSSCGLVEGPLAYIQRIIQTWALGGRVFSPTLASIEPYPVHPCPFACAVSCACVLSHVQLSATPWTVARQAPLSLEFFRRKYRGGLPFPTTVDLPDPGIPLLSLASPALVGRFFTTGTPGKPHLHVPLQKLIFQNAWQVLTKQQILDMHSWQSL